MTNTKDLKPRIGVMLYASFDAALEGLDLSKGDAVHTLAEADGKTVSQLLEDLRDAPLYYGVPYPVTFLLEVVGPRFA